MGNNVMLVTDESPLLGSIGPEARETRRGSASRKEGSHHGLGTTKDTMAPLVRPASNQPHQVHCRTVTRVVGEEEFTLLLLYLIGQGFTPREHKLHLQF